MKHDGKRLIVRDEYSMTSSTLHAPAPGWLGQIRFVLARTSHPGNVGAAARAMQVMGLRELVLVAPRDCRIAQHPDAVARASGALAVLERAVVVDTLDDALAPCALTIAVSAETRAFGPAPQPPEEVAALAFSRAQADPRTRIAFVFGSERDGLSIEEAGRCQRMCTIPGESSYSSLNLAQAVQIVAYCLRAHERLLAAAGRAADAFADVSADASTDGSPGRSTCGSAAASGGALTAGATAAVAEHAQIEALYAHLERALIRIGFLDLRHPKKLMPRLRRLFARAELQPEEVALLRGVCTQIEKACRYPYGQPD